MILQLGMKKLAPMDEAFVYSLISGRHSTDGTLAKFLPGVVPLCSLCQSQDPRRHRLFERPALAKFCREKLGIRKQHTTTAFQV